MARTKGQREADQIRVAAGTREDLFQQPERSVLLYDEATGQWELAKTPLEVETV